jgi:AcrR family transcriptional regulator
MPKVVNVADQRARIRDAARRAFARGGVASGGLGRIAEQAGISRTGIYHYYPNKDALVRDLARELLAEEEVLFERALSGTGAVDDRIVALVDTMTQRFFSWSEYGQPLLEIWASEARRLRPLLRRLRRQLAALIKEGKARGDIATDLVPMETATMLVALMDGLMFQVFIDPTGVPHSKQLRRALKQMLHVLISRRPAVTAG